MKTYSIERVETFDANNNVKMIINGKEETYLLTQAPAKNLTLVQREIENILQKLDLDSVISNLDNAAGLLFVAHNALAGTKIQSKISGLQKELQDLCSDSIQAIISFQVNSDSILGLTTDMYEFLLECDEEMALKKLARCSSMAGDMQAQCKLLAAGFDSMATKTQAALEASQDEQAVQYQQMTEIRSQLNQMQADQESRIKNSELLQQELEQTRELYEDAKQKEEAAAKEDRNLRLISAITSGITGVFGGITSAIASSSGAPSKKGQPSDPAAPEGQPALSPEETALLNQKQTQQDSLAELKRKQVENQTRKKCLEDEVLKLKTDLTAASDALNSMKEALKASTPEEKDGISSKIAAKEKDMRFMEETAAAKQREADGLSTHEADYATAISAANGSLNNLTKQLEAMGNRSSQMAQEAKNESRAFLKQKFELEKQNRELLSTMAKFSKLIEGTTEKGNQAETAVKTLQVAILCLKQISVALSNAALFWSSVERFCRKLAKSQLAADIEDLLDIPPERRLKTYKSPKFAVTLISYLCSWVALSSVCESYVEAAGKSRTQIQSNIQKGYLPEESWRMAADQAHDLLNSVNAQIAVSDQTQKQLQAAQEALA